MCTTVKENKPRGCAPWAWFRRVQGHGATAILGMATGAGVVLGCLIWGMVVGNMAIWGMAVLGGAIWGLWFCGMANGGMTTCVRRLLASTTVVFILASIRVYCRLHNLWKKQAPVPHPEQPVTLAAAAGWNATLAVLRRASVRPHVVVDVRFGLANRLRGLASAMALAASERRPLAVAWMADEHVSCSIGDLMVPPLPFALVDAPAPLEAFAAEPQRFQVVSYMPGYTDPYAPKDAYGADTSRQWLATDRSRHLVVRTAYQLRHLRARWDYASHQLKRLRPVALVAAQLVADASMVGVHVRSVVDALSDDLGANRTALLTAMRKRSAWSAFVSRMAAEDAHTRFFVAADSEEAIEQLSLAFPGRVVRTQRPACASGGGGRGARVDLDRGCCALHHALADLYNLAHTRRILGSAWSSFTEVAGFYSPQDWTGLSESKVPIELVGKDF